MISESTASKPFDLTRIGPFTEEEMTAMASAILKKIDIPFKSSDPAPKRPFIGLFGTQKAYKTAVTTEMEKFFRRNKFKCYCPPESAEHEDIRADVANNPIIYQAKHLNVVMDQYLNGGWNRDYHFTAASRNNDDMLYWYEKGRRKGLYSERHVTSAKEWIYQILGTGGMDLTLFFTCSIEAAMKREYGQSVTQKRGSKMNEKDVAEGIDIYETIIRELSVNVPNLPLFRIDTSEMTVKQATEEALRFVLPTLCIRYNIPDYSFMPYALSLVQKIAKNKAYFEEQLKLRGHADFEKISKSGWSFTKESYQKDTYLKIPSIKPCNPEDEVIRIREEDGNYKFMYKGASRDHILSHRQPHSFSIEKEEVDKLLESHEKVTCLTKKRAHYRKDGLNDDGHFFSLHVDSIKDVGFFTEIRARGSQEKNHTQELLALAEELGFSTSSIVNGNYLSLALKS